MPARIIVPRNWHQLTAQIHYLFPDYRRIISPRTFTHQLIDDVPGVPELRRFLKWWDENIEGPISFVEWAAIPIADSCAPRSVSGKIIFN